jgi:D-glutamate cyclase
MLIPRLLATGNRLNGNWFNSIYFFKSDSRLASEPQSSKADLINIAEIIDHLISVPVFSGSSLASRPVVLDLYSAARSKFGRPLSYDGFEKLSTGIEKSNSGSVMIVTGFIVPPWFEAETDGPVGAASLAMSLNLAWDLTPVVVIEPSCVSKMESLMKYAGLRVKKEYSKSKIPRRGVVEGFTLNSNEAKNEADKLISKTSPSAIIFIEKASPNSKGVYHSGVGVDVSPLCAKVDALADAAREIGIPTIGIGDAGNEIGMGCIEDQVRKVLPTGNDCGCLCHGGVASSVSTDSLIVTGTSNWGASALEALISFHFKAPELLHVGKMEEYLIQKSAELGFINPASGLGEAQVDAIPAEVHASLVNILNFVAKSRYTPSYYMKKYREYTKDKEMLAKLAREKGYDQA